MRLDLDRGRSKLDRSASEIASGMRNVITRRADNHVTIGDDRRVIRRRSSSSRSLTFRTGRTPSLYPETFTFSTRLIRLSPTPFSHISRSFLHKSKLKAHNSKTSKLSIINNQPAKMNTPSRFVRSAAKTFGRKLKSAVSPRKPRAGLEYRRTTVEIACALPNCTSSACAPPVYTLPALDSDPFFYSGMLSDE
jgi:hypothetical protein